MMNKLLSGTDSADRYNFAEAARWCERVPGGMRDLEEIFIPINPGGNHWNFIQVGVQEKQVELWDSMGLRPSNEKYLLAAERFIKDAIAREEAADRGATSQGGQEGWQKLDRSLDSPRQGNGFDCGIFTLTSMCLVRNGLRLTKEAYTQGTLTLRRARRRLAERIWGMGVNSETARWPPQETAGTTSANEAPTERATRRGVHPSKRRKGPGGRLVRGGSNVRCRRWGGKISPARKKEGSGSKRSTKSEAEEEGSDRTRVRIFQLPKKRTRNLIAGR